MIQVLLMCECSLTLGVRCEQQRAVVKIPQDKACCSVEGVPEHPVCVQPDNTARGGASGTTSARETAFYASDVSRICRNILYFICSLGLTSGFVF